LKERDFNELLGQIKSAKAQAAAARQELASLKRSVLNAVELSTKTSSQSIRSHLKSDGLAKHF
jgi:outer membrane protein TolC